MQTARIRWNILAACCAKPHVDKHVWYVVINECTDASIFVNFVTYLINISILDRGDIVTVENCTVHINGNNGSIQNELLKNLSSYYCPATI